jgi:alpha-tubulin suppressor-like RCC1 family protein
MFELDCKEKIEQIALGGSFAAALTSKGKLFMWGSNWSGQLGNGTTINSPFPIDITSSFRFQINESIISIKLGDQYSSALTSIGRLHVWGSNQFGQLGDGTQSNLVYPTDITPVFGLSLTERIVELSLGIAHSSIITSNGRMFIWGANWYGQLGNETTKNQSTPIDITNLLGLEDGERIHKISLGNSTLVLTSWGRLLIWGFNMFGEVGDGTTDNRLSPYDVTISLELTNHESILSALTFGSNTFVLTNTMKLIGWGVNWYGQLGNGTLTGSLVPTLIFEPIFEVQLLLQNSRLFPQQVDVPYFSREGYLFNGWYTDLLLTQLFNPDLIMEDSAYLYGEWIPE